MNARARAQLNGNKTFRFRLQFSSFVHFLWSRMRMRANTQFCMHFVSTDFRFDSLAFLAAGTSTLAIFSFVFHRFSLPSRKIPIRFVWPLFRHRRRLVRKLIHSLFLHFILFRRQFLVLHIFFFSLCVANHLFASMASLRTRNKTTTATTKLQKSFCHLFRRLTDTKQRKSQCAKWAIDEPSHRSLLLCSLWSCDLYADWYLLVVSASSSFHN